MKDTKNTKDKAGAFKGEGAGLDKPCGYYGLSSHKSMVKQQRLLNTMLSEIIRSNKV